MSNLKIVRCDGCCGNEVANRHNHKGWLHFDKLKMSVTWPRKWKCPKPNYVEEKDLDFCGIDCFNDWIDEHLPPKEMPDA